MRFVGHGHPAIRATHAKTLELTREDHLSERGTCVIAVGAVPRPPAPMAGRVAVTISAAGERFTLRARANPEWDPAGPAVIRRGLLRLPGTLATHADAAAADLPPALVAALQDERQEVVVDVEPDPDDAGTVVLFAADPTRRDDPRLAAEYAAADTVERQDAPHLLRGASRADGRRHLVVATAELPRPDPGRLGDAFEYVGLPPRLAVVAATDDGSSVVLLDPDARPADALRRTPATHRIAFVAPRDGLADLLATAERYRGRSDAVVAQRYGPLQRADAHHLPELFGRERVAVCLRAGAAGDLDPTVRAAVEALLADGVPTRTVAAALAALTGTARRAAYQDVLSLAAARRRDCAT